MLKPQVGSEKVSLDKIKGLEQKEFKFSQPLPGSLTHFTMDAALPIDLLFMPKPDADRLFVLFCGDADRERYSLPVFQRWKWADRFPGHCLYVSDPTLHLHKDLGLGWYCGTPEFDPLVLFADIVRDLATAANIPESKVVLYGSSAGGFAVLRLAQMLKQSISVTINPQVRIVDFNVQRKVDLFLEACFPGLSREEIESKFDERISLMPDSYSFKDKKIIYAQNILDRGHYAKHYLSFFNHLGINGREEFKSDTLNTILFKNSDGHPKAEAGNPEVFERIIDLVMRS